MRLLSRMLLACAAVVVVAQGAEQVAEKGADQAAAALLARLHQPAVLRGQFVQSRQIAGFKRPVESSGDFVVARDQGLLWHTVKPFESTLSVSRERLRVTNGKGAAETTLDARREPMLRTLNDILQSVVIADVAALEKRFDLAIKLVGASGWEMVLTPKDATLRARFSGIQLAGGAHVQNVRLMEASGDVTAVRFEEQREDTRLSDAEAGTLR
jgi:outer membrane lipoprotein-sorting protein